VKSSEHAKNKPELEITGKVSGIPILAQGSTYLGQTAFKA